MWAGGTPDDEPPAPVSYVDDGIIASLYAMNAPPEVIAEWESGMKPAIPDFEVHQDNWEVFSLFRRLDTQWHMAVGMASAMRTGLNYTAVESFFNLLSIPRKKRPEYLHEIQLMEHAALEVFSKKES